MRIRTTLPLLAFLATASVISPPAHAQTAIGQWRDHYPYLKTLAVVEGGGKAYCATAATSRYSRDRVGPYSLAKRWPYR